MIPRTQVTYLWRDKVRLVYDGREGTVVTYYPDGKLTGGHVVPADDEHAGNLGITLLQHRLAHELMHHLLARYLIGKGCPILWAAAHNKPMPQDAELLEWKITAATYAALGVPCRHSHEYNALRDLHDARVDLGVLYRRFRWTLQAPDIGAPYPSTVHL